MSAADVAGDVRSVLALWEHSLSRQEFDVAVALAEMQETEPVTLGDVLLDRDERRRMAHLVVRLEAERAQLERLERDRAAPALATAFRVLGKRAAFQPVQEAP